MAEICSLPSLWTLAPEFEASQGMQHGHLCSVAIEALLRSAEAQRSNLDSCCIGIVYQVLAQGVARAFDAEVCYVRGRSAT
jgi:hypothetical protein